MDSYNFSLIDRLQFTSNVSTQDHSNDNNIDITQLNHAIAEALQLYNKEVTKISEINTFIDSLRRKESTVKRHLEMFSHSINDMKAYVDAHFQSQKEESNSIQDGIGTIESGIAQCASNLSQYVNAQCTNHSDHYSVARSNIDSMNTIFQLVKFNKHICPICFVNECSHFTLPCGHVYCKECIKKLTISCFVCRQNIYKVSSLYFS